MGSRSDHSTGARHHRQQDLLSPLITISDRVQLLARMVQRSSSLTDVERVTMLDGLAIIEVAVRTLVTRTDAFRRDGAVGRDRTRRSGGREEIGT